MIYKGECMNLENIKKVDNELYGYIVDEYNRQQSNIELIASENFTSLMFFCHF